MRTPARLLVPTPRTIVRDAFELVLPDGRTVTVQRVRDPRARRVKLSVDERGARLTLPPRASLVSGERFAGEHGEWLARQLDRHGGDTVAPLRRFQTASLPLRGVELPLRWQAGRYARLQHAGDDDRNPHAPPALVFAVPERAGAAALGRAASDFYEAQARADIGRWLPRYLPALPRAPRRFRLKQMSSRWGSLAPDATVALDLSLVLARPAAFEYVLVHELCHLLHADHSRAFWTQVEARCPHWREERDYLRAEGRRLKATMRRLLEPADPATEPVPTA